MWNAKCRVDSISGYNIYGGYKVWLIIYDKEDSNDTANTTSSSINADDIETEGTGTDSSVVRACDTDESLYTMICHNCNWLLANCIEGLVIIIIDYKLQVLY